MPYTDLSQVDIIAPNFKRRLSGVTSTIVQLVPVQNRLGHKVAVTGPGLPASLPRIRKRDCWKLWKRPKDKPFRIWHARRNVEMLPGIIMRDILRMPLKLLFTSAAQRHHSGYTKWLISKMDDVVATSVRSGSFLKVPHHVVMHGVDLDVFHPSLPGDAPSEFEGDYLIGCFGRIRHQKGTDLFVDAMIALLPEFPQWTAVITGRVTPEHQSFYDDLKAKIEAAGLKARIRFLGEIDDVKPLYRQLTLYVAPSRNEGFGLTPIEAMASQTAVVASNAGAYEEMIEEDETGYVVPAGDGEALRDAIRRYLEDPQKAKDHAIRSRKRVEAHFDLKGEAEGLYKVYSALFGEETNPKPERPL